MTRFAYNESRNSLHHRLVHGSGLEGNPREFVEAELARRALDSQGVEENASKHSHHWDESQRTYEHAHRQGEIPHGHHGSRYGATDAA